MAKVFVSSVFREMENFRSAVAAAIESLGQTPKLVKIFLVHRGIRKSPALPEFARLMLLYFFLASDMARSRIWGFPQPTRNIGKLRSDARLFRSFKEIITFGDDQDAFAAEVRSWNGGHYSASFDGSEDLRKAATAALHRWELSQVAGSPNQSEMLERAIALLPQERQSYGRSSMAIALAGWPVQPVLRPSELEDQKMRRDLLKEVLLGRLLC